MSHRGAPARRGAVRRGTGLVALLLLAGGACSVPPQREPVRVDDVPFGLVTTTTDPSEPEGEPVPVPASPSSDASSTRSAPRGTGSS